jgi:hypothetical protein
VIFQGYQSVEGWHAACAVFVGQQKAASMSIGGISGNSSPWQWHHETSSSSGGSATGQAAASGTTDSVANTGTASAGNMAAFFQSFSADLQSMLSQSSGNAGNNAATGTQTTANQPMAGAHHHHHHGGAGGATQGAATQMTARIGLDGGGETSSASAGISQAANSFSADVMKALRAYGSTAPATTSSSAVA